MDTCKYYDKHLEIIRKYIDCLYSLENCGSGGILHILTDDDNVDDDDIAYCLSECLRHPEREESGIGKLICEEYLKLPIQKRRLLTNTYIEHWSCMNGGNCKDCFIEIGEDLEM